jgi:hypothetical protein
MTWKIFFSKSHVTDINIDIDIDIDSLHQQQQQRVRQRLETRRLEPGMFFLILINIHLQKDNSKVLYFNHDDNAGSEVKKGPNNVNHGLSPRKKTILPPCHPRTWPNTANNNGWDSRLVSSFSGMFFFFFLFFFFSFFIY